MENQQQMRKVFEELTKYTRYLCNPCLSFGCKEENTRIIRVGHDWMIAEIGKSYFAEHPKPNSKDKYCMHGGNTYRLAMHIKERNVVSDEILDKLCNIFSNIKFEHSFSVLNSSDFATIFNNVTVDALCVLLERLRLLQQEIN